MSGVKERKLADGTSSFRIVVKWRPTPNAPLEDAPGEYAGKDKREAYRLLARRKREVKEGRYKPMVERGVSTIGQWGAAWAEERTGTNADDDRSVLQRLVWSRSWFADLPIADWRVHHTVRLIKELQSTPVAEEARRSCRAAPGQLLAKKYVQNIYGLVRTMCRDARIAEVLLVDACLVPRGLLKGGPGRDSTPTVPYRPEAVRALCFDPAVAPDARVFNAIAFFTGNREGEICGYRWRDYDPHATPLGGLSCTTQYTGRKLKSPDGKVRPRSIPVHPELARVLEAWWREGWELSFARKPTAEDRIVPSFGTGKGRVGKTLRAYTLGTHSKSSAYKMWRRACDAARVDNQSLHATRHTFITQARRVGCAPDHLERVTHNARGTMIDRYTHLDWDPLCEAVVGVSYAPPPAVQRAPAWGAEWVPPGVPFAAAARPQTAVVAGARRGTAKGTVPSQVRDIMVEAPGIEPATTNVVTRKQVAHNERCAPAETARNLEVRSLVAAETTARSSSAVDGLVRLAGLAADAGEWSVVAQLASELEARRRDAGQ